MYVYRTVSDILSIKEWRDFKNWGRGCSISLKMVPLANVASMIS